MDTITEQRILSLHPAIRIDLKAAISIIEGVGLEIRIVQGFRSYAEQDALYYQDKLPIAEVNKLRFAAHLPLFPDNGQKLAWASNAKGGQSYHCYSEDTEILTDEGWKLFSDLNKEEQVMVFKDGNIYYEKPIAYINNVHDGEMISIQTRSVDLLVTPEHRMIAKRKTTNKWQENWDVILAKDIDYKYKIPTAGNFSFPINIPQYPFETQVDPETWWEFMGWYISEGSSMGVSDGVMRKHNLRFKVSISQKEGREEWHLIKDCLDRMGFHYNYIGHEFIIYSKELHEELFKLGNTYQKRIPRYLLNSPKHLLELLYESLILGDGTNYDGHEAYWTVNELLANDVSELSVLLGKSCIISEREARPDAIMPQGNKIKNAKKQYHTLTRAKKDHELRNGDSNFKCITKEEYHGNVYCVTTSAGALVVKRNGKISICGNCFGLAFDFCIKHKDGSVSFDFKEDSNKDQKSDFLQVIDIFKNLGFISGMSFPHPDNDHLEKTFGHTFIELDAILKYKKVDSNGYVII